MANTSGKIQWETGIQLLARLGAQACVANLEPLLLPDLQQKMVVEIIGKAGCGKTELLYHLIARCILPPSWNGLALEGIETGALFIDTNHHFNLLRLVALIEKRIHHANTNNLEAISNLSIADVSDFVKERLKLLHLVRCTSSEQLLVTLHSVGKLFASDAISILFIDSISAFYWLDRMNFMDNLKKLDDYYSALASTFRKLIEDYCLILIATKQVLMKCNDVEILRENCSKTANSTAYDFMGRNWQKIVNYHLTLEKFSDNKLSILVQKDYNSPCKMNCVITDHGIEVKSELSAHK